MTDDLDAAIREAVEYEQDVSLRDALTAVLNRHKSQRLDDEHDPYCDECSSLHGVPVAYPCRTVRDVATELGVEVSDA